MMVSPTDFDVLFMIVCEHFNHEVAFIFDVNDGAMLTSVSYKFHDGPGVSHLTSNYFESSANRTCAKI